MTSNGSRRWFQYTSDNATTFAVELDESVYETADLGFAPIDTGATGPTAQGRVINATSRRPVAMRRVRGQAPDGSGGIIYKSFYVGTQAALSTLFATPTLSVDGRNWSLTSFKGEERTLVPATDTGQTDGDVDSNVTT